MQAVIYVQSSFLGMSRWKIARCFVRSVLDLRRDKIAFTLSQQQQIYLQTVPVEHIPENSSII
jgi:hypothetical protein